MVAARARFRSDSATLSCSTALSSSDCELTLVGHQVGNPFVILACLMLDRFRAGLVGLHPIHRGTSRLQGRKRDFHLPFKLAIVQPSQQLTFPHEIILVYQDLRQALLNTGANRGFHPRFKRPGAHDFRNDILLATVWASPGSA